MSKKETTHKKNINMGTMNKFAIQKQALELMKNYPKGKTLKDYAYLLSWDLGVSSRTALENYVFPMVEHLILLPSNDDDNTYCLNNGGNIPIPQQKESATDYMKRKDKEKKEKEQ